MEYFLRFERKKIKVYALHKIGIVSLAIYAMVNENLMVYYMFCDERNRKLRR